MDYKPLYDKKFRLALSDVVFRFHVCDQYEKDPERAIKALMKRAPGYSLEDYRKLFESNLKLLITIMDEQKEAPKSEYKNCAK
jgi:hypothetical protein